MSKLVPRTTIDRYFSLHYGIGLARRIVSAGRVGPPAETIPQACAGEDTCVARHHNGICVVCLSPRHPIVRFGKQVSRVDYRVEMREVKGKRKRGGIVVEERTKLCTLSCASGEVYSVQCTVKGTLAEYNLALKDCAALVVEKPLTSGYLAVILPWPSQVRTAVDELAAHETYEDEWKNKISSS